MVVLTAAVIFVGLLCFFDLILSFAIIRKFRASNSSNRETMQLPGLSGLPSGRAIPPVTVPAITGERFSVAELAGRPAVVAFFAAQCPSCRDHLDEFAAYAAGFPGGERQVAAIIAGDADGAADIVDRLTGLAQIVIEPDFGPVASAFAVQAFPTFVALSPDGVVDGAAWVLRELPLPQVA